jgi:ABC-2 type transport system ATP-binding protein
MADKCIELVNLTKKYGSFTAVDQLNLTIKKGEVFGLLGPNGAGKSTTILMLLGLTEPTDGYARICGINAAANPIDIKRKTGYLPEDVGFYDDLSGMDNLLYTAQLNSVPEEEALKRAESLLKRVGLWGEEQKKAGVYSKGMRQRLGLADVLIKSPEVIILDEPTSGIDPGGVKEFLNLIIELSKEDGLTVLFSSHHLHQVQRVCDRVGIFVGGRLLAEGNLHDLATRLFSGSAYTVEVGINGKNITSGELSQVLINVDGIEKINPNGHIFEISCAQDVTNEIAKALINKGILLTYLNQKEYALDDIYYRYFEGGEAK